MSTIVIASRRALSSRRAPPLAVLACAAWLAAAAPTLALAQQDEEVLPETVLTEELPAPLRDTVEPPEDLAAWTLSAAEWTVEFEVAVLPPLFLPSIGAPELTQVAGDPRARPLVPITARRPGDYVPQNVQIDLSSPATRLMPLDDRQSLMLHIDGLPSPDEPARNRVAPVLPRAVDPQGFSMGATWDAEDRIRAPLLDAIAWQAQAGFTSGAAGDRGTSVVRKSLRLTAGWDRPQDVSFGLSQGVQVGGGTAYQHYATGVRASILDTSPQSQRFSSYVELSGEHLALGSLAENPNATVQAGASYRASSSTEVQMSITRCLAPWADMQSSVGLSMHF
jgi:hypothetical protein